MVSTQPGAELQAAPLSWHRLVSEKRVCRDCWVQCPMSEKKKLLSSNPSRRHALAKNGAQRLSTTLLLAAHCSAWLAL